MSSPEGGENTQNSPDGVRTSVFDSPEDAMSSALHSFQSAADVETVIHLCHKFSQENIQRSTLLDAASKRFLELGNTEMATQFFLQAEQARNGEYQRETAEMQTSTQMQLEKNMRSFYEQLQMYLDDLRKHGLAFTNAAHDMGTAARGMDVAASEMERATSRMNRG